MEIRQEEPYRVHGWEQSVHCLLRRISREDGTRLHSLHYHDYIELLYGLEGCSRVLIADRVYEMAEGDLLVVNAGEPHDVLPTEGESRYFVVKFLPELLYSQGKSLFTVRYLLSHWQKELSFAPALRAAELSDSGLDGLFREIMREWEERSAGYELIIHAAILRIFVWVLRNRISVPQKEAVLPARLRAALEEALSEAQAHIYSPWTAEMAAERAGLSYSYFSRSFKTAYGLSFSAYLESLRLDEAERLLLTTDRGVTEIAAALGFGTTSYFIERFGRRYGASPRKFRQRVQSGDGE